MIKKAIAYIDGYNLYEGILDKNNKLPSLTEVQQPLIPYYPFLWLNLFTIVHRFIGFEYKLQEIKYFTAAREDNPNSQSRMERYHKALDHYGKISFHWGKFDKKTPRCHKHKVPYKCPVCDDPYIIFKERKTDVKIATEMLADCVRAECDMVVLVSADTDLIAPVEAIRELFPKIITKVIFPPSRASIDLATASKTKTSTMRFRTLNANMLPYEIKTPHNVITCPNEWLNTHPKEVPINWGSSLKYHAIMLENGLL